MTTRLARLALAMAIGACGSKDPPPGPGSAAPPLTATPSPALGCNRLAIKATAGVDDAALHRRIDELVRAHCARWPSDVTTCLGRVRVDELDRCVDRLPGPAQAAMRDAITEAIRLSSPRR